MALIGSLEHTQQLESSATWLPLLEKQQSYRGGMQKYFEDRTAFPVGKTTQLGQKKI